MCTYVYSKWWFQSFSLVNIPVNSIFDDFLIFLSFVLQCIMIVWNRHFCKFKFVKSDIFTYLWTYQIKNLKHINGIKSRVNVHAMWATFPRLWIPLRSTSQTTIQARRRQRVSFQRGVPKSSIVSDCSSTYRLDECNYKRRKQISLRFFGIA